MCDTPSTPINGSFTILSAESGFTEGTEIVLQCDDGLFPSHPRTATCVKVQEEESGCQILLTYFVKKVMLTT